MKVLLFGGAGYIGTHVAMAFLDRGDHVGIYDRTYQREPSSSKAISSTGRKSLKSFPKDGMPLFILQRSRQPVNQWSSLRSTARTISRDLLSS